MFNRMLWVLCMIFSTSESLFCSIHINFKDLEISQLIEITSKTMKKNILNMHTISGKVNFTSNQVHNRTELLEILNLSLNTKGYMLEESKNFYTVVKNNEKKTAIIELKNSDAQEIVDILNNIIQKKESTKISLIKESNALLIYASSQKINMLKNMIKELDMVKTQVYVKAKIIEVNNSMVNNIGIEYGIFGMKSSSSELFTFSSNLNGLSSNSISVPSINLGLSLDSIDSILALGATINLLKQNNALNVVSEPSILCLNNKTSSIYVGEKKSIKTASSVSDGGTSNDSFTRENIGLTLKVKPRISSDNKVQLQLQTVLENFSQTSSTNNQPDTFKKEINTSAIVNNGESVIIGGLIEDKSENVNNDIPFISDIPILGNLFKNTNEVIIKNNLVIIVTPYIISKHENLTQLRNKLAKLQSLEDDYLEKSLTFLKNSKTSQKDEIKSTKENQPLLQKSTRQLHEERLKEHFGI